MSEMTLD